MEDLLSVSGEARADVGGGVVEIDKKMNLKLLNSLDLFNQR